MKKLRTKIAEFIGIQLPPSKEAVNYKVLETVEEDGYTRQLIEYPCGEDKARIGTLGHSYGGNTVLFLSAMDERISFACASGNACTFEHRMKNGVGIEMASVIPGFHGKYDVDDVVVCIAPRKLLLVSSEEDKYSMDAPYILEKAGEQYAQLGALQNLYHKRYPGAHALTEERFADILEWVEKQA